MNIWAKARKLLVGTLAVGVMFSCVSVNALADPTPTPSSATPGVTQTTPSDTRFVIEGNTITGLTDVGRTQLQDSKVLKGIPDTITEIGPEVFSGLGLTKVELPAGLTKVGDRAFFDNKIAELKAPGLKDVGQGGFQRNQLTSLPNSDFVSFGQGAFADNQLEQINLVSHELTVIPADAFRDNKITSVQLPVEVGEIGDSAFASNQLENFDFHSGLAKIGDKAFSGNRLTKVDLPDSLTEFGKEVFADNGRWIEIGAHPAAVTNQAYEGGFGHVVDAVTVRISFVDDKGVQIQSDQVLASEFSEPDGVHLKGVENKMKVPAIEGFEALSDTVTFTPDRDDFPVEIKYKRVDYSPRITGKLNKTVEFNGDGSATKLLEGVTATDYKGNPLTVTVSPESVDTSVQGSQVEVFYTAVDSDGRSKTVKGNVLVGIDWPEMTICPGWQVKDFKYRDSYYNSYITGFSDSGKAKAQANGGKIGCWPQFNDKGKSITDIGNDAFANSNLTQLPDSWGNITKIGDEAFTGNKLTFLPRSWGNITQINNAAFSYNQLTQLPESWGKITRLYGTYMADNKGVFQNNKLTHLPDSWGNINLIYSGSFQNNQITYLPDSWGNLSSIDSFLFSNNRLTKLPSTWNNISYISAGVFQNNQLTKLPDSWGNISRIGYRSFYSAGAFQNNQLTQLPDSWGNVTDIGSNTFQNNKLTSLPDNWGDITKIGSGAFHNNQLTHLPDSWGNITSIDGGSYGAFSSNQLTSLPDSWGNITNIGSGAFQNNQLTQLPDSWGNVTRIGGSVFRDNQLIQLPDSWGDVTRIDGSAFQSNQLIQLPDSWGNVTIIDAYAFANNKLTHLPDSWGNITSISSAVFRGNQLVSVPDSWGNVISINGSAFANNKIAKLPASWGKVTEFINNWGSDGAFANNQLTGLPGSWGNITNIKYTTFSGNGALFHDFVFTEPDEKLPDIVKLLCDHNGLDSLRILYIKPKSGTNPNGVKSTCSNVKILVDTPIKINYVDESGNVVKPQESFNKDSLESNTYMATAPILSGYEIPDDQTINLDGLSHEINFVYKSLPKSVTDKYGQIFHKGVVTHAEIGRILRSDLTFDSRADGDETLTNGSIQLTYDPTNIEFIEAGIISGVKKVSSPKPGLVVVQLDDVVPVGTSFTIPIHWKLKNHVTAMNTEYPIEAVLLSGCNAGMQAETVNLLGWYNLPTFYKTANSLYNYVKNVIVDDFDGTDHVAETGKNAVTYYFSVDYLERNIHGYTITDTLPQYTKHDGSTAYAQFDPAENKNWALNADGKTLTYTSDENIIAGKNRHQIASLILHYHGAKFSENIINNSSMELKPQNQGEKENSLTGEDYASIRFFKSDRVPPPGKMGIYKEATGPHRDIIDGRYKVFIYDTPNDKQSKVTWKVVASTGDESFDNAVVKDYDLDPRLQYSSFTPDSLFVGGSYEVLQNNKVIYSSTITSTDEQKLPEDIAKQNNISLRFTSVSKFGPNKSATIHISTVLRNPDEKLYNHENASKNFMHNTASLFDQLDSTDAVEIFPAGKTFEATKTSDFSERTLTGKSGTYTVGTKITTDYGTPATNFQMVDVLPKGLDVEEVRLTSAFAKLPDAKYEILSNFNGSDQTAIRFTADQVDDESSVYQVANIQAYISDAVPDGTMTNDVYVTAKGENIKFTNEVVDPIVGSGSWSKADTSTEVSAATQMIVRKQLREPGKLWTSEISTVPGADFDYRIQVINSTDETRTNPIIYDLMPVVGDQTLYNGARFSEFSNQVKGAADIPAGWDAYYTCDSGLSQDNIQQANWSSDVCDGVTGMKFVGSDIAPRSQALITVPMIAGPVGSNRLSTEHLGQKATNHVTYIDGQTIGLIESNPVINILEAPKVDIKFKKLGVKLIPLVGVKTAPLAGATFGLFDDSGNLQATAISGKDGMVHFNTSVRPGWVIKETNAPKGFNISNWAYTISEQDVTTGVVNLPDVKNMSSWVPLKPITGSVEFTKVDKNSEPISGAEFKLTPKPDSSGKTVNIDPLVVRSNSDGLVKFYDVPAGVYELSETPGVLNLQPIAPKKIVIGHMGQVVKVDSGQVVNDKGRVEVTKLGLRGIDRKGFGQWTKSDGIAKPGAVFELLQGDSVVGSYTTDANGRVELNDLDVGTVYGLRETQAPNGYELNPNVYRFQVTAKGLLASEDGSLLDVQDGLFIPNEQSKYTSSLLINKTDPNNPVSGAVFELARKAGDDWVAVTTATSNVDGKAEFTELTGGQYRVREISAPLGYAPTNKTYEFMVDDYNPKQFTWEAVNYSTSLVIYKFEPIASNISSDAADKLVSENKGAVKTEASSGLWNVEIPLAGAIFDLLDDSGQLVTQVQTDQLGIATVASKLDATKTYQLVETTAPSGYIKKLNPIQVRIADHSARTRFKGQVRIDVPNTARKGKLVVSKMASGNGKPLEGATFELTGPNGFKKTATSDKSGLISFDGLDFGTDYQLKETKAPKGYRVDDSARTVRVGEDNPVSTQAIYNRPDSYQLVINKVSDTNKPMAGVEFTLGDGAGKTIKLPASNQNGVINAELETGKTYRLKEIKTLEGYALLPQDISIKFSDNGVIQIADKGVATVKTSGTNGLIVTNYPQGKVPLSGQGGILPILFLGALAIAAGVPLIVGKRKRKGCLNNEKVN